MNLVQGFFAIPSIPAAVGTVDEDAQLVVTLLVKAGKIYNSISSSCALTRTYPVIVLTNLITYI
eukprot:5553558-Prorocentrum_lima.AAC.1